jgi:putative DNA primase/helicase
MRQDFFTYSPQFKLLIAGNNKPSLRDVDEAMRRRLHLIPFTVTIPVEKRDQGLSEALLRERGGILRWALEGCLAWQRGGLKPPASVAAATAEYFESEDSIGRWISEACAQGQDLTATTGALFSSWKAWADHAGEWAGSEKRFSQSLEARGLNRWRQPGTGRQGFRGLALNAPQPEGQEALL